MPEAAPQLTKVLAGLRHTFVVADYTLPDCPLVFASDGYACNSWPRCKARISAHLGSIAPDDAVGTDQAAAPRLRCHNAVDPVSARHADLCGPFVLCRFLQMTGYTADEVLGHNWCDAQQSLLADRQTS